jgi:hypothetical protein
MRSTILTLSALLGLSLCVMLEVSAEKPGSNQASISTPVTLSKRGGKKHKGGKGHGGKHHGGKGGSGSSESGKSEGGGDSSKGDDIFGTVSKTILEKLPDNVNHAISGLKLPTGGK